MKNLRDIKMIKVTEIYVKDNDLFSFLNAEMDKIITINDFKPFERANKRNIEVNIDALDTIRRLIDSRTLNEEIEKNYRHLIELSEKIGTFQENYTQFNVTPE